MTSEAASPTRVVVATDFSPGADAAIARAALLPVAPGGTLTLLHVIPASLPAELRDAAAQRAEAALRERAGALAREVMEAGRDVRVEHTVATGTAYVEIIRLARGAGAGLVVIGRHGPRRFPDLTLGSTAERVVRKGDVPTLVVGGAPAGAYQRPLVAVDLSDASRRVTELALTLLPGDARRLALVHAFEVPFESWLGDRSNDEYRLAQRAAAETRAAELTRLHAERGVECRTTIGEGDPRAVILRAAVHERSDLLVVGTHGRSGLAHAMLGSVAEWLIRAAPCDVAVTRPARFTFEAP